MYDFLDKIGLKAVLEAIKGKIPTSLPANGGNADTVDGLHAEKFMRYEPDKSLTTSINDMTTAGTYGVYTATPDFPTGYGTWGLLEVQVYGSICYQIIKFESGIIINRAKIVNQTEWSEWKRLCDGGNADTVDGMHAWTHGMLNSSGGFDPSLWFTCQHNIFGDDRYGLLSSDGKQIRCHYASEAYNAALLGGVTDAYHFGSIAPTGLGYGNDFKFYCQYNIYGDNRFGFRETSGNYGFRVDYATDADTLDGLHASDIITSSKPYVTGTAVRPLGASQITTNHGFMPSAVIWWYLDDNIVHSAFSFNNTLIELDRVAGADGKSIKYIIFK